MQKRVEALEEERCQARYDEVTKEPRQELNDARKPGRKKKIMPTVSLMMPELSLMMAGRNFQTQRINWLRAEKNTNQNYDTTVEQLKQQQAQLDAGKAMMSEDQIAQAQGQIDAAYAALDEAKKIHLINQKHR